MAFRYGFNRLEGPGGKSEFLRLYLRNICRLWAKKRRGTQLTAFEALGEP